MSARRVLVLEPEKGLREVMKHSLSEKGFEAVCCSTIPEAAAEVERGCSAAVIDLDAGNVLEWLRHAGEGIPVVLLTRTPDPRVALEAMRLGARDLIAKPFPMAALFEALDRVVDRVIPASGQRRVSGTVAGRRAALPEAGSSILGRSPAATELRKMIAAVAPTDSTVLISGETGVGKELVAREIHTGSRRRTAPFVAVNCAAIPETLLESELFGHEKGAYTGALGKRGKFALAEGGTVFLDEIGELPLALQAKLLRVLQEREIEPVGATRSVPVDVRIVAATNRDLREMVAVGEFRSDLFFRLNVVPIHAPPLRARGPDIALLFRHFLEQANSKLGTMAGDPDEAAVEVLLQYPWPGNVRELAHLAERLAIFNPDGPLTADVILAVLPSALATSGSALPSFSVLPEEGMDLRETVAEFERSIIRAALERTAGNKNRAAGLLRMNRTTLVEKLKRTDPLSIRPGARTLTTASLF